MIRWGGKIVVHWGEEISNWTFVQHPNLAYYEQRHGNLVVYLERRLFGAYVIKLYQREHLGVCLQEYQVDRNGSVLDLLDLADHWLETYQDGDPDQLNTNQSLFG